MTRARFIPAEKRHVSAFAGLSESFLRDPAVVAFAAEIDGRAVAIGGFRWIIPQRSAEGFLFVNEECFRYPAVWVQMRTIWHSLIAGLMRIQLAIDIRKPERIRFAYFLGCEPESVLRNAGPDGEDYIMFVRLHR